MAARRLSAAVVVGTALAGASAAHAQSALSAFSEEYNRGRNSGVLERTRPEYATSGISVGAFTLSPVLNLNGYYDDNIFARKTATQSDEVLRIAPSLSLGSDWTRNSLVFSASLSREQHIELDSQSSTDYSIGVSGATEVLGDVSVSGSYSHSRLTESRLDSSAAAAAPQPSQYDHDGLSLQVVKQLARIRLRGAFNFTHDDFSDLTGFDGGLILNSRRSNSVYIYGLRGDYALTADTSLFAAVSYDTRDFGAAKGPSLGYDQRDSKGVQWLVGANFDLTNLIRGEIGVGYVSQSVAGTSVGGSDGFSASARVDYFPSQLTTISATATRSFTNSSSLDSPGELSTSGGVRIDHELKRNLLLFAQAALSIDDFVGIDRTDVRYTLSAGATYLVNRAVQLNGSVAHATQSSSGLQRGYEYDDNKILLGVTLRR